MSSIDGRAVPEEPASSHDLFVNGWNVYRKMVDNDYLGHVGAYAALRRLLLNRRVPFTFLDVACGDSYMSAKALSGTLISDYTGIDISEEALSKAGEIIAGVGCKTCLIWGDFRELVPTWKQPVDVVWIGLSLHHLRTEDKGPFMAQIRRILTPNGVFAIYEDSCFEGESRKDWLHRWDAQQPLWTTYAPEEWKYVCNHVHGSDFPESDNNWESLGRQAGFRTMDKLFESSTQLFSLYSFSP